MTGCEIRVALPFWHTPSYQQDAKRRELLMSNSLKLSILGLTLLAGCAGSGVAGDGAGGPTFAIQVTVRGMT